MVDVIIVGIIVITALAIFIFSVWFVFDFIKLFWHIAVSICVLIKKRLFGGE